VTEHEIDAEVSALAREIDRHDAALTETTRWPWAEAASHRAFRRWGLRATQAAAVTVMAGGVLTRHDEAIVPACLLWALAYGWAWLDRNR
jgi:hypothetical protein